RASNREAGREAQRDGWPPAGARAWLTRAAPLISGGLLGACGRVLSVAQYQFTPEQKSSLPFPVELRDEAHIHVEERNREDGGPACWRAVLSANIHASNGAVEEVGRISPHDARFGSHSIGNPPWGVHDDTFDRTVANSNRAIIDF